MAIDYTELFTDIGVVVAQVNHVESELGDWDTRESDIQAIYETSGQQVAMSTLISQVDQIQTALAGMRDSLSSICDARLQDYDTVISQLNIPTNDVQVVLSSLIVDMNTTAQKINANVVSIGSVTAASANTGNGTILLSKILDGVSAPVLGALPQAAYAGLNSQFGDTDTLTFVCKADSYSDGQTSGSEIFNWYGTQGLSSKWAEGTPGAGQGPDVSTTNSGTIIVNGDMELFSVTDTPDGWVIASGIATTNVLRTSTGANVYSGTYSVALKGDGATSAVTITQDINATSITPLKLYCVTFRYKASATDTGKTFTAILTGTGYTAGTSEKLVVAGASLPTSWTLGYFWVLIPANPPSDMKLSFSFSGTPTLSRQIFIDSVGFNAPAWHNGVAAVAVPGSTPFVRGDRFTVTTTNSYESLAQNFFSRQYLVNLPSTTAADETISDSLFS